MKNKDLYGAVILGWYDVVFAIADRELNIISRQSYHLPFAQIEDGFDRPPQPIAHLPGDIARLARGFFSDRADSINTIGVSTFGPLDREFGVIRDTPHDNWGTVNLKGLISSATGVERVCVETDTITGAFGAYKMCEQKPELFVFLTLNGGLGGAFLIEGKLPHKWRHPEMGHIRVPLWPFDSVGKGVCPKHANCLEGIASQRAIEAYWQERTKLQLDKEFALEIEYSRSAKEEERIELERRMNIRRLQILAETRRDTASEVMQRLSEYYALWILNVTLTLSPDKIGLAGIILDNFPGLGHLITPKFDAVLGTYGFDGVHAPCSRPGYIEEYDSNVFLEGILSITKSRS